MTAITEGALRLRDAIQAPTAPEPEEIGRPHPTSLEVYTGRVSIRRYGRTAELEYVTYDAAVGFDRDLVVEATRAEGARVGYAYGFCNDKPESLVQVSVEQVTYDACMVYGDLPTNEDGEPQGDPLEPYETYRCGGRALQAVLEGWGTL